MNQDDLVPLDTLHIIGASHPGAIHLEDCLSRVLYGRIKLYTSRPTQLSGLYYSYSDLTDQFCQGDKIVSFAPPSLSYPLIQLLLSKSLRPSTIIQLSSTSIDTKVLSGSADSSSYLHFLAGEHSIVSACLFYVQPVQLYILRLSLLWGSADRNVSRIYQLLTKYRIFPLLSSSKSLGSRAPIHYKQLACYIQNLLTQTVQPGIYNVMGPEVFSYDQMVADIAKTVGSPICLLKLNRRFLALLLRLASSIRSKTLCSILSMILRQKEDLVYTTNALPISVLKVPNNLTWSKLLQDEFLT